MTLGTLRLRLLKQFPGLDLDVLDGFISDRYGEILAELPWSRLDAMSVLQTSAPYETGTVAVTEGSASITLTSGTWTTDMTGRAFRVAGRDEYYEFVYVTATTGTLDRVYEGDDDTAASYKIWQSIYPLPADCRHLGDDAFATTSLGPLRRLSRAELNVSAPTRAAYGTPDVWTSYMDDGSTPPRMQIELYPIPDEAVGIPFEYVAEASVPGAASTSFLPWVEPATALVEGVIAKIYRTPQFKDLPSSQLAAADAESALSKMRANEARRQGPSMMSLSDHYTSHRRGRW